MLLSSNEVEQVEERKKKREILIFRDGNIYCVLKIISVQQCH